MANSKLKLLYILELLYNESDEEHPIDTERILLHLRNHSIECERKSIYSDITVLRAVIFSRRASLRSPRSACCVTPCRQQDSSLRKRAGILSIRSSRLSAPRRHGKSKARSMWTTVRNPPTRRSIIISTSSTARSKTGSRCKCFTDAARSRIKMRLSMTTAYTPSALTR